MSTTISKFWHDHLLLVSSVVVICFSMLLAPSLFSQTAATGALTGTLRDSSGAVVPNATVTATNTGTGQARTATTSSDGSYSIGLLPPGVYGLKFEASGFSPVEVPSVSIVVTETAVLDQILQVGAQTQQVEVHGEATEAVQTATSTVGTVVNSDTMTATPLTSRNYTNLLGLSAGANSGVFNAGALGRGSSEIAVNGSTTSQNGYSMDGANIVNSSSRGLTGDYGANPGIAIVNPDAIQEFKIQTSLFDAGYGRNPGGSVDVVTKSGTNQFHGTAFEFFRNTALNANDFFRKLSPAPNDTRQVLNQNQYGGTFGGPVKKDKLFFFTAFQESSQKNGISVSGYSDPTLVGIPQGDRSNTAAFQAALGAAFCPGGSATAGTTGKTSNGGTQVACNGSNINPVAINLLQLKNPDGSYFIPSSSTGVNQNTTYSIPARYTEHQAIGNFDYVINPKNTLSGRWFYMNGTTNAPMGCAATSTSGAVTGCLPDSPGILQSIDQYIVGKVTTILSTNLVNEARISLQSVTAPLSNPIPFTDTQVGIAPIIPSLNLLNGMTISGLMQWGAQTSLTSFKHVTQWEASDELSWSHGAHTIRAGFEYERDRVNFRVGGQAIGNETFQTFQDFLLGLPGCAPSLSAAACAASATAGLTNGTSTSNISSSGVNTGVSAPRGVPHAYRVPAPSAFVQDDFKVRRNLTLNLGLRWEYLGVVSDALGNNTNIWPSLINAVPVPGPTPATGTLAGFVIPSNFYFAAYPAPPVGGLFQSNHTIPTQDGPSKKDFAPRIGLAWKPLATDRFVVRGGFGYFYDRAGELVTTRGPQAEIPYTVVIAQSGASNYFSTEAQPYAPTTLGWTPRWVNINTATNTGTSSNLNEIVMAPNPDTPTTYEWNLNTQYEFLPSWVLEVGYVGTRGIHQLFSGATSSSYQINQAQLASPTNAVNGITTNTVANAAVRVPYLGFGAGTFAQDSFLGDGKFNSLQATLRKQLSHGLQLQAAYTFSRSFTTVPYITIPRSSSNGLFVLPQYGLDTGYRPQRFTVNYVWDLPFGKHEGLLDKLASGWNLAGVTVVQDGIPQNIEDTRGGSIYGFGSGSALTSMAEYAAGMGPANVATPGGVAQRLGGTTGGPGYFNKAAFATTPVIGNGTGWGDVGYGTLLGPGQFNFDATIQKTTKVGGIHEDATLVFRTEFFNMFNHPQFNNPASVDVSKSTFGQITSSSVNPRLIQFALKYLF